MPAAGMAQKKRKEKMFALKQDKMLKRSDKRWLRSSFCFSSNESRHSYRSSDSADAGSQTF
jgi:hypothetical protein